MKIYLVGGAVRDQLLGIEPQDRDWVVVGATVEQMLNLGYKPVGKDFPVFLHPETKEEYALARTERKSGHGYHGFSFHAAPDVTLEEDLRRRDLTINAMAQGSDGTLIDPYAGEEDLQLGRLRHVSPAFREDPLRVLRVARYAARYHRWGFRVAHSTQKLLTEIVESGELQHLVPERVWLETQKVLAAENPQRYFEVLRGCGALKVIFPELEQLFGVPQPKKHHPEEDSGVHTLMVLEQAAKLSAQPEVRFAALLHDLGKGTTNPELWPKHHAHEERGYKLVENVCARMKVPSNYRDLAVLVARYHGLYHRAEELRPQTMLGLLEKLDLFRRPERLELFLAACEADSRGRMGFAEGEYLQVGLIRNAFKAATTISGRDMVIEGFSGKEVGERLRERRIRLISSLKT